MVRVAAHAGRDRPRNDASRGRRRAEPVAVTAIVALLAAACGAGHPTSSDSASTASAIYPGERAYALCMRAHGLTNFPIPERSPTFNLSRRALGASGSPAARANDACEHLLPSAGTESGGTRMPTMASSPGATDCLTASQCYAPRQFLAAYGIPPLLDRGITGRGVTVVLPEQAEAGPERPEPVTHILQSVTDLRQDLAAFDSRFGLPPAHLQAITSLAGSSASPWLAGVEEVEDTELVHAVAPDADLRELLVKPADVQTPAKFAATFNRWVRLASSSGAVISQSGMGQIFNVGESSWTRAEVATINSALQYAAGRQVTVVVASGDDGAIGNGSTMPVREVSLPASDPLALAAGGTTLTANPATGAYRNETVWNDLSTSPAPPEAPPSASGGGFSHLFARPAYQDGVPGIAATRGVPDVAGDASSGNGGMALAFTAPHGGHEFIGGGGTSAAAPFWAGLIALADQDAGHPLGLVNPAIYRIAGTPRYHNAFHDITTGDNTVRLHGVTITGYHARPGWDPATGWGTPDAQILIPLLAH